VKKVVDECQKEYVAVAVAVAVSVRVGVDMCLWV